MIVQLEMILLGDKVGRLGRHFVCVAVARADVAAKF
jgi:hypothetical protein